LQESTERKLKDSKSWKHQPSIEIDDMSWIDAQEEIEGLFPIMTIIQNKDPLTTEDLFTLDVLDNH